MSALCHATLLDQAGAAGDAVTDDQFGSPDRLDMLFSVRMTHAL